MMVAKSRSISPVGVKSALRVMLLMAKLLAKRNCRSSACFAAERECNALLGACAIAIDAAVTDRVVASEITRLRTKARENKITIGSHAVDWQRASPGACVLICTLARGPEFSTKNGFRVDRGKASELIVGVIETEIGGARTLKTNLA